MRYNRLAKLRRDRAYIRKRGGYKKYTRRPAYAAKKRPYRKRVSNKRILNVTSRKKRNGMLCWSNTDGAGASRTPAIGPFFVSGSTGFAYSVWQATAQTLNSSSIVPDQAARTATTCYMRGLSEHLKFQTSTGLPWFHRRICFTIRGINAFSNYNTGDTPTNPAPFFADTSNGIERQFLNLSVNNAPKTINSQVELLFKGTSNRDWTDVITAPLDTTRIGVKYDKTFTISSGNANGIVREKKLWHPMNKNLVYDDEEGGAGETPSYYSTDSKLGMGDYFVVDIFQPGTGGTSSDLLKVDCTSTLYWHEK